MARVRPTYARAIAICLEPHTGHDPATHVVAAQLARMYVVARLFGKDLLVVERDVQRARRQQELPVSAAAGTGSEE